MAAKQIVDQIRPGDTIYFRDRFGVSRKGKAVMYGSSGWVLNMGGRYGTPATVAESKVEKVVRSRSRAAATKSNPAGYIDSSGRFRPIRSGIRYGNYKGQRMQWQDKTAYDDVKATGGGKASSSWSQKLKSATKKAKGKGKAKGKRNPSTARVPSVKSLEQIAGSRATELRSILKMDRNSLMDLINKGLYPATAKLVERSYGRQLTGNLKMEVANEICETSGVEYIPAGRGNRSPAIYYLNAGDTYNTTLLMINGDFKVGDWGSIVEKGNYE